MTFGRSNDSCSLRLLGRHLALHSSGGTRETYHRFTESRMVERSCKSGKIEALVPMKRAGTLQEVAYLVGFLATEKADYICGHEIGLNGGMT